MWLAPGGIGAFALQLGNGLGVRPSDTIGTQVVPGNNTYGSYAQLIAGASVTDDIFGLSIHLHDGSTSAAARDIIATIGIDPAGGTSYTDLIPHLLGSNSGQQSSRGGFRYYFPIKIPAGASIGCKGSVNNGTVGTFYCEVLGDCRPRDMSRLRYGTRVEAIGAVTANSAGTAVTPGQASIGAWTSLGTLTNDAWWFQQGMGCNDATMTALSYHVDCASGDGSNKDILIQNHWCGTSGAETMSMYAAWGMNHRNVPAGVTIYGRMWCSATPDSNISQIVYALGG